MGLALQLDELDEVTHGIVKDCGNGGANVGGLHGKVHALVLEFGVFFLHILR